jgi:CRISPR-associated protein Cmr4
MYHISKPLFLYCETPLHAGSGSELGVIDLPIQRERHTSIPKIEGSSLKGALRERAEQVVGSRKDSDIYLTFGPEGDGDLHAGALGFTDARLLLFPVKSMRGVFAWVTCPQVLKRFWKDMQVCEGVKLPLEHLEIEVESQKAKITSQQVVVANSSIVLEEYAFEAEEDAILKEVGNWLIGHLFDEDNWWKEKIGNNLVLLSDDDFRDFVNLSTEVITRTKINNLTGTVQDGALFTEEYLPAESVLYSLVLAAPVFPVYSKSEKEDKRKHLSNKTHEESDAEAVIQYFGDLISEKANNRLQVGANATIGKGLIRTTFLK